MILIYRYLACWFNFTLTRSS